MSDNLQEHPAAPIRHDADLMEKKADVVSVHVAESQGYDRAETKKLLRKLDWHLIPFMSLIYL
jgi:predicted PP-loop superfamily ATPase